MKCIVTGAAGFIGSHLCEFLLAQGHTVDGIDAFIPYYAPSIKEQNLEGMLVGSNFRFHRLDLRNDALDDVIEGADSVFHLAAMPGLERSWTDFDLYESCNVIATHRVLEATRRSKSRPRIIHASTSSVYGRTASGDETQPTAPVSPYGITKLAAENLCRAYGDAYGLSIVVLRYFSVYGPRQRPDMGYYKFIRALLRDEPITVFGDGQQSRSNTFVDDCVAATAAALAAPAGEVYNVGGGESASVWDILKRLEGLAGRQARVQMHPARPGDQRDTCADTGKLTRTINWQPSTRLDEGLVRQWNWQERSMAESDSNPSPLESVRPS